MPNRTVGDYRLTPKQQEAYDLYHQCGLTYSQIARRLGISVSAVNIRLHRARMLTEGRLITTQAGIEEQDARRKERMGA